MTKTDPAAGQSVPKGTTITIYVSSGMTTVPSNLVGQSKDSVLQQYEGKFSFTVEQESSDTVEAGLITRVSLIRALPSHRAVHHHLGVHGQGEGRCAEYHRWH